MPQARIWPVAPTPPGRSPRSASRAGPFSGDHQCWTGTPSARHPPLTRRLPRNPIIGVLQDRHHGLGGLEDPEQHVLELQELHHTTPTPSIALATSPLFFSFSLSMSAVHALRGPREYLDVRALHQLRTLGVHRLGELVELPQNSPARLPIACRSAELRTPPAARRRPRSAPSPSQSAPIRSAIVETAPAASGSRNPAGPSRRSGSPPRQPAELVLQPPALTINPEYRCPCTRSSASRAISRDVSARPSHPVNVSSTFLSNLGQYRSTPSFWVVFIRRLKLRGDRGVWTIRLASCSPEPTAAPAALR